MTSAFLTAEHESFRAEVRGFLDEHITPHLPEWEQQHRIPASGWKALGAAGLLGLRHSPADGGSVRPLPYSIVALEELGRTGYSGFRAAVGVHAWMATHYLSTAGSPDLRHRYLGPAVRGEQVACLAVTEPQAGSDLTALTTTATADAEGYRLNGSKTMVTNACSGGFAVVAARTEAGSRDRTGLSLLVVDLDAPGVTVTPQALAGWHCSGNADVTFDQVHLPAAP